MGIGIGVIGGAMQGAGEFGKQVGDYAKQSSLQQEAAEIQKLRDDRLEGFASAREQRGYKHSETLQQQGFTHTEALQAARQKFDTEQHELNRGLTREQMKQAKEIADNNNARALEIAKIGGTVQQDDDGNVLWVNKEGKATPLMNGDQPVKAYKNLTPAAKAYSDVLKAQLTDLDRMEIQANGDPQQLASIRARRAEYTGQLLNVLTGGIGSVQQAATPTPSPRDIEILKANPKNRAAFDQQFGAGAADRALGAGGSAAPKATEAAPADPLDVEPSGYDSPPPVAPEKKSRGLIERERVMDRQKKREKEEYAKRYLGNI